MQTCARERVYVHHNFISPPPPPPPSSVFVVTTAAGTKLHLTPFSLELQRKLKQVVYIKNLVTQFISEYKETHLVCVKNAVCKNT